MRFNHFFYNWVYFEGKTIMVAFSTITKLVQIIFTALFKYFNYFYSFLSHISLIIFPIMSWFNCYEHQNVYLTMNHCSATNLACSDFHSTLSINSANLFSVSFRFWILAKVCLFSKFNLEVHTDITIVII